MDDRELVSSIRARIAQRVGADRYEVWFGPTTQLSLRGETLVVSVPSLFYQDWLRTHFRRDIEASLAEVSTRALALEFRVEPVVPAQPAPSAAKRETPVMSPVAVRPAPALVEVAENTGDGSAPAAEGAPAIAGALPRRPLQSLDTFVVGHSNCLAHKAAQMALVQPGSYSPLVVHGPTGTGKTHLLEGIYSGFRKRRPRAAAVYLSAEQFTSQFLSALHKRGMASFRSKYRDLDLLVIEDLQFLANKRATIGELQHTIDHLLRHGKQLVFSADQPPAAIKNLGPELISRLSGGMVCRLDPPEFATRQGIVRHQAALLGMNVPEDVQSFVAAQLTTQARELIGALKRLHAMSLAHNRPITLELAQEALAELCAQSRAVKLPDIEKAVCDVFGLEPESLQSEHKGKQVSHPRMLAMYLARKYTRAPLSEIGNYFGKRSHSTVISAQKKIEALMSGVASNSAEPARALEETLRKVEAQLRAG
jgi:chromosomal replication initiator protein